MDVSIEGESVQQQQNRAGSESKISTMPRKQLVTGNGICNLHDLQCGNFHGIFQL